MKVRRFAGALAVSAGLAGGGPAWADFAAGVAAFETGDYTAAHAEWLPLARDGDAAAQRNLGLLYLDGLGVARDTEAAAACFRAAADQGNARAQANLGTLHLTGDGVRQSFPLALEWFLLAAEQGHAIAQFNLGLLYESGLGTERNVTEALRWYTASLQNGHDPAFDRLRAILSEMRYDRPATAQAAAPAPPALRAPEPGPPPAVPVAPVIAEALEPVPDALPVPPGRAPADPPAVLVAEAAEGRAAAQLAPITPPAEIEGVAVAADAADEGERAWRAGDHLRALANLWTAAVEGHAQAQLLLGGMYRDGAGLAPDRPRAHFWWTLAARSGDADAANFLPGLERTMAPEEIAEAARLLAVWDAA